MTGIDALAELDAFVGALLATGAALEVTTPGGGPVRSWPLARHHRLDPDVLWVRPLAGGRRTETGAPAFPLGDCLRKGIGLDRWSLVGERIRFELASGQTIDLRPATTPELEELELWDRFVTVALTAEDEAALDRLDADSWHGPYL